MRMLPITVTCITPFTLAGVALVLATSVTFIGADRLSNRRTQTATARVNDGRASLIPKPVNSETREGR